MQFKIRATSVCEWDRFKLGEELIITKYPWLKDFGFEYRNVGTYRIERIHDETGRVIEQRIPRPWYEAYITIDTLEQLIALQKAAGLDLIINEDAIEIYDDYRG